MSRDSSRRFESGPGFIAAIACPDCLHTRCGEDCVCNCDAARAEHEAAALREQVKRERAAGIAEGQRKVLRHIESLMAEFGDDPVACAPIIGEYIGESVHALERAARDGGQVAGDPVRRFLAHQHAEWIGRGEYAVKPSEPIYDHWMAEYKTFHHGEEYSARRWGATPEAACLAALRALGDGAGEERGDD